MKYDKLNYMEGDSYVKPKPSIKMSQEKLEQVFFYVSQVFLIAITILIVKG